MRDDNKNFNFFHDRLFEKLDFSIKPENIYSVVKRPLCVEDKNTISIFYNYQNKVKELKLRCIRRCEVEEFIKVFKQKSYKKYKFEYKSNRSDINEYLLKDKPSIKNAPFHFYTKIKKIEDVLKYKFMQDFLFKMRYFKSNC